MTPGIPIPGWAALALFVAMALAIVALLWQLFRANKPPYAPLADGFGSYYVAPGESEVTPERIADALNKAAVCLTLVWPSVRVMAIARECAVWVMAHEVEWVDSYGRRIAGQHIGRQLFVARDLSALAHELAHVLQLEIDRTVDMEHTSWTSKGIHAAIAEFHRGGGAA